MSDLHLAIARQLALMALEFVADPETAPVFRSRAIAQASRKRPFPGDEEVIRLIEELTPDQLSGARRMLAESLAVPPRSC
jgi:hypothetical protein